MSGGFAHNSHLYGGLDGNPVSVTPGGNMGAQLNYDKIVNIGRLVLRTGKVTRLPDVPAAMIMVFNAAGNGNVWWAGYDTDVPAVGVGIPIPAGTSVNLYCTDTNQISFIPEHDGDQIYVIAFASGTSVPLTPSNPPPFSTTPPTLSPSIPATNNATGVNVFTTITIIASAALDPTTINSTGISISPSVPVNITYDSNNPNNILIIPTSNFAVSTTYTITVATTTGGVADLNGNHLASTYTQSFTTASTVGTPDTTPPTIVSSNPLNGGTSYNPSNAPTITFSEPILLSSVNANNVTAFITNNNQQIPNLSFSLTTDQKTLIINNMSLVQSTNYQINILGGGAVPGLTDLVGNHIASSTFITFATSSPPGTILYSVSGNSYDILQSSSGYTETSILINSPLSQLLNRTPINFTFVMKRVGSPSGNIVFVWERLTNYGFGITIYSDYKTLGTIGASSLPTSDKIVTIDISSNTASFIQGDRISVRYNTGGNPSNYVLVKISNYDAFDGGNTCNMKTDYNGNNTTYTSSDLAGTVTVL
jgi:hypothetical protein